MVGGVLGTLQLVLSPLASPSIIDACTPSSGGRSQLRACPLQLLTVI